MKDFDDQINLNKKPEKNNKTKSSKEQIINQAINFHLQGNIEEATKYYQYLISQKINDERVFSNYGAILQGINKLNEAADYYLKAIELNPNFANAHSNLGGILSDLGDMQNAERYTRKAIELNPDFADAHLNLGNILRDLGKLQESEISTRKAIELNPNLGNAHLNLGNILRDLGDLQNAEISTRKATELNPDLAIAHSNLGNILRDLGKLQEAEISTRKATELNPNLGNAHLNLGSILKDLGKLQEAEISTRKAIELNPNLAIAHSNLGGILSDLGDLQNAEIYTRKAIELNPDLVNAHLNLGIVLKDQGELKEAEIYTRKAIELNPDLVNAHLNLGSILRDLGKLQEAEIYTRKAIELNPDFAMAHSNLGNILKDLGNLKEAEISTRKAIELNPDFAMAHSNLGGILSDVGDLQNAEIYTRKAIELNPNFEDAHLNLGSILSDLGKFKEAFNYFLKLIEINPENPNIYSFIVQLLKDSDLSQLNSSKLKYILKTLLESNDVSHKELFEIFSFLYKNEIRINLQDSESVFSKNKLDFNNKILISSLKKIIFRDLELEKLLKKLRRNICNQISKNIDSINSFGLKFIIALGEQCFLNEYVYSSDEEEIISVNQIIKKCKEGNLNEINISILSCYYPLYKLLDQIPSLESYTSSDQDFNKLIELQIKEPLKEIELSKRIKKIGTINNDISLKVKSQYEENPYPRWRYVNNSGNQKISILQVINNEIKPNNICQKLGDKKLNILIAGCGTGNQILQAQRYKNAKIIAIDLSLASLAYAKRKIIDLGLNNVELIQMDILEVNLLEKKFDIIECGGVLHHMENPTKGLKKLLAVLKNNGFLKLGLYSELARQDIITARKYINKKLQTNNKNIRDFRQKVISNKLVELESFKRFIDFYSLSEFRDLCFHAQEHRYSINQIHEILESNKLEFLGFLLPKSIKSLYKKDFPKDEKQTNLLNWNEFEKKYPSTFTSMYQFWVSKK